MKKSTSLLTFLLLFLWLILVQVHCPGKAFYWYNDALVPVYADSVKIHQVVVEPPRSLKNTAKIYYKDSTIYIIEKDSGIHVIDNRLPATPKPIRFIKLLGCADIAIKGTTMYADNYSDLVTIDVSNPNVPKMVSRITGMYPTSIDGKPAMQYRSFGSQYQCIDSTKGKVISWTYGQLDTLKCYNKL
jgi:hypothetical protein